MFRRAPIFFLLFPLAMLLAACSPSGKPSARDAKKVFLNLAEFRDGIAELRDFEKTNGQERELFGVKIYTLEYEVKVRMLKDGYCGWRLFSSDKFIATSSPGLFDNANGAEAGETVTLTGSTSFELTERGWKGSDGNVY